MQCRECGWIGGKNAGDLCIAARFVHRKFRAVPGIRIAGVFDSSQAFCQHAKASAGSVSRPVPAATFVPAGGHRVGAPVAGLRRRQRRRSVRRRMGCPRIGIRPGWRGEEISGGTFLCRRPASPVASSSLLRGKTGREMDAATRQRSRIVHGSVLRDARDHSRVCARCHRRPVGNCRVFVGSSRPFTGQHAHAGFAPA